MGTKDNKAKLRDMINGGDGMVNGYIEHVVYDATPDSDTYDCYEYYTTNPNKPRCFCLCIGGTKQYCVDMYYKLERCGGKAIEDIEPPTIIESMRHITAEEQQARKH